MIQSHNSTIHKSANITERVEIEHPVHVGARVEFQSGSIGRYTFINNDTKIFLQVRVGRFSTFARGCQVAVAEHPIHHLTTSFFGLSPNWFPQDPVARSVPMRHNTPPGHRTRIGSTVIGNDVWIGANAIILKGVNVGHGAVIGAGAIVTKDVPPYSIVAGNPGRIIRQRFDPELVRRLLVAQWWNLPPAEIASLPLQDPLACLALLERRKRDQTTITCDIHN